MRIEDLQRTLDDLAGRSPDVDGAFRAVTGRARRQRRLSRLGIVAGCVLVAAGVTFGAVRIRSTSARRVSVVNPAPAPNDVAHLAWTRIAAPSTDIVRVVTANGQTFAVGSTPGAAVIYKLGAGGGASIAYREPAGTLDPRAIPAINDVAGIPGVLAAVGQSVVLPGGRVGAAAWRSADDGHSWERVAVDPAPDAGAFTTILRVVVANRVFYAIGKSYSTPAGACPNPVWTSADGAHYRLMPTNPTGCGGDVDASAGPSGVVAVTSNNATAWRESRGTWSPHRISTETAARVSAVDGDARGYVAVGSTGDPARARTGAIWWSPDAETWTRVATDSSPPDPTYQQASFTGIAHTPAGWIAVGWQLHPGGEPAVRDATLWTSSDGRHWDENTGDAGTFAQHAIANRVGVTSRGFAINGAANITGTGTAGDPIRQDDVLWIGSPGTVSTPASTTLGAAAPRVKVGPASTITMSSIEMIFAFGSIWVSQPDRVARFDPATGRLIATIAVPGTSDARNLAAGAGAIWVDDSGTETLTRIDALRNRVIATIPMHAHLFVVDGLAFVDGKLWVVRPVPNDEARGDVVTIDPATNRVSQRAVIPRTFDVMASGTHALWYVRGTNLLRFDTTTLRATVVRQHVNAMLAAANQRLWLLTPAGVIEADERTGKQIGPPIAVADTVNLAAAVGPSALWLAGQPDSSSGGNLRPYDLVTHQPLAAGTPVGFPIVAMTALPTMVLIDADGVSRIPYGP